MSGLQGRGSVSKACVANQAYAAPKSLARGLDDAGKASKLLPLQETRGRALIAKLWEAPGLLYILHVSANAGKVYQLCLLVSVSRHVWKRAGWDPHCNVLFLVTFPICSLLLLGTAGHKYTYLPARLSLWGDHAGLDGPMMWFAIGQCHGFLGWKLGISNRFFIILPKLDFPGFFGGNYNAYVHIKLMGI